MNEIPIEHQLPPELMEEFMNLKEIFKKDLKKLSGILQEIYADILKNKSQEDFKKFYYEIHKLTGSSGMYGYADISKLCQEIGNILRPIIDDYSVFNEEIFASFNAKYNSLHEILKTLL